MERNEKIIKKGVAVLLILLLAGVIFAQSRRIKEPVFVEWDYTCLPDGAGGFSFEIWYIADITDHRSINLAELIDEREQDKYIITANEDESIDSKGDVMISSGQQYGLYICR